MKIGHAYVVCDSGERAGQAARVGPIKMFTPTRLSSSGEPYPPQAWIALIYGDGHVEWVRMVDFMDPCGPGTGFFTGSQVKEGMVAR